MIGSAIAHCKVTARLGAGGMGEVYRATDTKLGRDVALKVLPASFAQDSQHMAVDVDTRAQFRAGTPRVFAADLRIRAQSTRNWDVARDGRILLAQRPVVAEQEASKIQVVQNFLTEVRRRLPGSK